MSQKPPHRSDNKTPKKRLLQGAVGIVLASIIYFLIPGDEYPHAPLMAALVVLMAAWWMLEVVPIAVTSLIPVVCFPLFGIADLSEIAPYYAKPIIFLFLGGFLLALGLQESGIHKRIALLAVLQENWYWDL